MNAPEVKREIRRRIAEHEAFLAFESDEDADLFHEWWSDAGWLAFRAWAAPLIAKRDTEG